MAKRSGFTTSEVIQRLFETSDESSSNAGESSGDEYLPGQEVVSEEEDAVLSNDVSEESDHPPDQQVTTDNRSSPVQTSIQSEPRESDDDGIESLPVRLPAIHRRGRSQGRGRGRARRRRNLQLQRNQLSDEEDPPGNADGNVQNITT